MLNKWHSWLGMKQHDKQWHENDLSDELAEYYEESQVFKKWSELSDVAYTCSRGRWSGHDIRFPFARSKFYLGVLYMIPKYTGRWIFFLSAGKKAGYSKSIHEVRNPRKTHKLNTIAEKYNIDPLVFQKVCEKQLKYWPLLP
ncbi:MAG: hypothetical protein ABI602_02700 [Candidatus Saccharibacteria bacterium]